MRRRTCWTASFAALVLVAACSRDATGPKLEAWQQPPPTGRLTGTGLIDPINTIITFAFDVTADQSGITGTFTAHEAAEAATLVTDPAADAGTSFTAFRSSSSFCATPSHGVEVDAVGHLREPTVDTYVAYTIKACDNGPGVLLMDTFSVDIPSRGFHQAGTVTGEITKQ